jgi:hypothetical protein
LELPAKDGANFFNLVSVASGDEQFHHGSRLAESFFAGELDAKNSSGRIIR